MAKPILERMWSKSTIDPITNCWLWHGGRKDKNQEYGCISFNFTQMAIHRVSAHLFLGMLLGDKNQQALHKNTCPNKNCWNPDHLYIGNDANNVRDSIEAGTHRIISYIPKSYCINGHKYDEENTYFTPNGDRRCRICKTIHMEVFKAK